MLRTPEISAILDRLAEICCQALMRSETFDTEHVDALLESLSTNGWDRHNEGQQPLSKHLEERIQQHCAEPAVHRGAEIDALVQRVVQQYNELNRPTRKPAN